MVRVKYLLAIKCECLRGRWGSTYTFEHHPDKDWYSEQRIEKDY